MATALYFAPTFFSPYYFAPLATPQVPPPVKPPRPYHDRDAYEAILALLKATKAFESVLFASPLDRLALGTAGIPMASLVPESWEEFDEVDPSAILRRVSYSLFLLVRDDDPLERFEQLDRLESVAQRAIEGSTLGGGCLPALTRIRRGNYDQRSLHPEQIIRLDGEFTYMSGTTVPALATS